MTESLFKRRYSHQHSVLEETFFISAPDLLFQHNIRKPEKEVKSSVKDQENEEKHSWVILCTVVIYNIIIGYHGICFGMYYIVFTETFHTSKALAGFIGSIYGATASLASIFSSTLIDLYGVKRIAFIGSVMASLSIFTSAFTPNIYVLYITYGLLAGIGVSFIALGSSVIIQQHFHKHKGFATSLSMCGLPIGSLLSPLITNYFLKTFGWRGTLAMQSGILLQLLAISMTYSPTKQSLADRKINASTTTSKQKLNSSKFIKNLCNCSVLRDYIYTPLILSVVLLRFNLVSFVDHIPSRTVYLGESMDSAGHLITVMCCVNFITRILISMVLGSDWINPMILLIFATLCEAICSIVLPLCKTYTTVLICSGLFGCGQGLLGPSLILTTVKLSGTKDFAKVRGLTNLVGSIGSFSAAPLTGLIFDITHNYDLPFYFNGIVGLGAVALQIFMFILFIVREKRNKYGNEEDKEQQLMFYNLEKARVRTFTC